ncbi:MAG: hypothetical protein GY924_09390 [Planctomycetaceae bacterium]|nr:hypothetical protein [Planctomycetaceae bacterium]
MIDLLGNSIQLLGMPLSSAALFLLAGTLLGHLLWYRDRGKNSANDPDLETRYLKVRSSLKQRKTQVKELQKQNDSIDEDLTNLRQAHSTLRAKNKRLEQISQSSQEEINQFRHSLNEAEIQLGDEEKRNQTVIDQLQELIEKNATLTTGNQAHQESFEKLDQQYRQCVSDLETAQYELDTSLAQARIQQTDQAQQQTTIRDLEHRIESTDQALEQVNESLLQTQQDLVARCKDLDALRSEKEQLDEQSQADAQTLTQLETDLTLSKQIQTERDEFATDLAAAASSLSEQRQALEQCEAALELKNANLAEQEKQLSDLNLQLTDERENRVQLEQFNAACQTQLAELESQLSDKTSACAQSDLALDIAQKTNAETQATISGLTAELAQSNARKIAFRSKVAELQQLVEQQQQQVTELCAIREENAIHSLDLAETRAQLALEVAATADLKEKANKWNTSQAELGIAQQTIRQYHERNAALESLFVQQTAQISELSRQADCVPELELALKHRQNEIELACDEIEQHEHTVLTVERVCDETQGELTVTIAELHAMENRILSMSDDIDSLTTDNALLTTTQQQAVEQAQHLQMELEQASLRQQQLEERTAELNVVKHEREQLLNTRDNLEATINRLGNQITNHLTEAKQISEVLSQTAIEHEQLEIVLQAEVEARDTTITELKTQLTARSKQHDAVVDDLAAKTSTLDQRQIEIEELSSQLEIAKATHNKNKLLTTKTDELEKQLQSKSEQHAVLVDDISQKSNEVAHQLREIERLSSELKDAESDRRERDQLKQEVTELRTHLNSVRDELEDSLDTNAKGQDRIRDMENQLHDHVKKIRDLRRERSASSALQITDEIRKPETDSDQKAA